jgi:uncharacterized repeat protein (TIGR01451 family)
MDDLMVSRVRRLWSTVASIVLTLGAAVGLAQDEGGAGTVRRPDAQRVMPHGVAAAAAESQTVALGTVPAGASITIELEVTVKDAGALAPPFAVLSNQADIEIAGVTVSTDDPDTPAPGDATLTLTDAADLSVSCTGAPNPVAAGAQVTYTVTVSNGGLQPAAGVAVTSVLGIGLSFVSSTGCAEDPSGVPTCSIGSIAGGASAQFTIVAAVDAAASGDVGIDVSVSSSRFDPYLANNTASATTTTVSEADLRLSKLDAPDPVTAGTELSYTLEVENLGPSDAPGVVVSDALPAGTTLVSSSGCTEDPNGSPTCSLGTLAAGATAQATLIVAVDSSVAAGTVLSNTATVSADSTDPTAANNTATATTGVLAAADLKVEKADTADPVSPGDSLGYTVTVTNQGPSDAVDVVAVDTLPAGVTLVATSGCAEDPTGAPTCSLGPLAAGATAIYGIEVTVDAGATGTLSNQVSVSSDTTDPDLGNNVASELTSLDTDPPTVLAATSVPSASGLPLDPCRPERAIAHGFRIAFSEAMADPPQDTQDGDVTNPASYLLVGAGADEDLATDLCGTVFGDDVNVPVAAAVWNAGSLTATLTAGTPLGGSFYRLMACAALSDAAGNPLDGDGDGSGGDDFVRTFRLDPGNALDNAHFDCSTEAWLLQSATPGEIAHSAIDSAGSPLSGSLEFRQLGVNTAYEASQCASLVASRESSLSGTYQLAAPAGSLLSLTARCTSFAGDDCTSSLGASSLTLLLGDTSGAWLPFDLTVAARPGRQSIRCAFAVNTPTGSDFTLRLDRLFLDDGGGIFSDGFETGDSSAWSAEVGGTP